MDHFENEHGSAILHESAFKNKCCVYRLTTHENLQTINEFMDVLTPLFTKIVSMNKEDDNGIIGYVQLCIQMLDEDYNDTINTRKDIFYFSTKMTSIYNLDIWLNHTTESLNNRLEKFSEKSSGWVIDYIRFGEFRFIKI